MINTTANQKEDIKRGNINVLCKVLESSLETYQNNLNKTLDDHRFLQGIVQTLTEVTKLIK